MTECFDTSVESTFDLGTLFQIISTNVVRSSALFWFILLKRDMDLSHDAKGPWVKYGRVQQGTPLLYVLCKRKIAIAIIFLLAINKIQMFLHNQNYLTWSFLSLVLSFRATSAFFLFCDWEWLPTLLCFFFSYHCCTFCWLFKTPGRLH